MKGRPGSEIYRMGNLRFGLTGSDPVLDPLREEFDPVRAHPGKRPELDFRFEHALPGLGDHVQLSPCQVGDDAFRVEEGGFRYQVHPDGDRTSVWVGPGGWSHRAPVVYHKARHWNYLSPVEDRAKNFVYNVFDYLSQVAQLPLGQSYVHASSMERDGEGLVVSAWGGIGKTTTVVKLVDEDGWRFLSDDLSLVDREGRVHPVPKKLQVYAYNLEGQQRLRRRLLDGRSLADRGSWAFFRRRKGASGVRRRVSAGELFGAGSVGEPSKIRDILHLERHSGRDFIIRPMGLDDLVDRCLNTLVDELSPFVKVSAAVNSTRSDGLFPSVCNMQHAAGEVLRDAFGGAKIQVVRVPKEAGPDELVAKVKELVG